MGGHDDCTRRLGAGRVRVGRLISLYHHVMTDVMTDCLGDPRMECIFGGGRGGVKERMKLEY